MGANKQAAKNAPAGCKRVNQGKGVTAGRANTNQESSDEEKDAVSLVTGGASEKQSVEEAPKPVTTSILIGTKTDYNKLKIGTEAIAGRK
jgi:hypothetical protein